MVHIRQHIPDAKQRKHNSGAVSIHRVIYNTTLGKNKRHDIIAATGAVCNTTCHLGDGLCLIHGQTVRGPVRAGRAVKNTQVFLMETLFAADAVSEGIS